MSGGVLKLSRGMGRSGFCVCGNRILAHCVFHLRGVAVAERLRICARKETPQAAKFRYQPIDSFPADLRLSYRNGITTRASQEFLEERTCALSMSVAGL